MKMIKIVSFMFVMALLLAFTACQEDVETLGPDSKTIPRTRPGDITDQPGGLPYPNIIKHT